jgi:hypothetical protein
MVREAASKPDGSAGLTARTASRMAGCKSLSATNRAYPPVVT